MKHLFFTVAVVAAFSASAQQPEAVDKMISYRRFNTAAQIAKKDYAQHPDSYHLFQLAKVYVASKDSAHLLLLQPTAANDPWDHLTRAAMQLQKKETGAARSETEIAVGNSRKKDPAVVAGAAFINIYQSNGDLNYAVELLDDIIKKDKKNPALQTMLGDAYFRLRNGSAAYTAYMKAVDADANYAPALFQLGKIFATQNNKDLFFEYYTKATNADPAFAPAWYELYYQQYQTDKKKALDYFNKYYATTDVSESDQYQQVDMLYLTSHYNQAINKGKSLLAGSAQNNRLNKLIGYSFKELKQPDSALKYMTRYFSSSADTEYLAKDYQLMAELYEKKGWQDSVSAWYIRTASVLRDSAAQAKYYKKLSDYFKSKKDYVAELPWAEKYYKLNARASNVDLFNWGYAAYMSGKYQDADSIFGLYTTRYPDQVHGPYWQARSAIAIDSAMTQGLAVPHYEAVIAIAEKDTSNALHRRYLKEAYGYLAAYVANEKKDYPTAIDYFEKLLEYDPNNEDAKKYIEILEKRTGNSANK